MWLEETISPSTSSSGCTTVRNRSSADSSAESPCALWPKRKFSPIATCVAPSAPTSTSSMNSAAEQAANPRSNGITTSSLTPSSATSSALRVSVVSSLGVCWGATTDTGCGSNVSTLSDPSITARWPRCTPSKVPTATLRSIPRSTSDRRMTFTAAETIAPRRRADARLRRARARDPARAAAAAPTSALARAARPRPRPRTGRSRCA